MWMLGFLKVCHFRVKVETVVNRCIGRIVEFIVLDLAFDLTHRKNFQIFDYFLLQSENYNEMKTANA